MNRRLIVAIDGPSASGKSTAGKELARRLGYLYIDTGAMYRTVALAAVRANISYQQVDQLVQLAHRIRIDLKGEPRDLHVFLDGEDVTEAIRTPEISSGASKVSAIAGVRQALVERQREMGAVGGVVMDGRDIGTHVFPKADVKFFLIADLMKRAHRRNLEEQKRGYNVPLEQTIQEIEERDRRDQLRAYAPLKPAEDSIQLNTSDKSPEQVVEAMLAYIEPRRQCASGESC